MINTDFTLYQLVLSGLKNNQRFICADQHDGVWKKYTSQEFYDAIIALALSFADIGIKKGDTVALHSENCAEWLISDLAITSIGAVTVPIYTTQSLEQIEYIVNHSEAKIIIVSENNYASKYSNISIQHPIIAKISFQPTAYPDFIELPELLKQGRKIKEKNPDLFDTLRNNVVPDDLVTIGYTSGTTGTPKGVMLTHRNLVHAVQAPLDKTFLSSCLDIHHDTTLSFLPFTHVFEHCAIYGYLTMSVPVYIVSDLEKLQDILVEAQPVHFTTVPRLLEKIYQGIKIKIKNQKGLSGLIARLALDKIKDYRIHQSHSLMYRLYDKIVFHKIRQKLGGKIRGITSGGAALSPDIMLFFNAIGIPLGQGYGLTETSPGLTIYDKNNLKLGTAGLPLEGVDLKIADDGEILAKGDNIMLGYFKEPEKTAEVIDVEGWFHTGDIGYIDEQGFLFITDRKKELLKLSTGKYVAPAPLENKLIAISGVEQAVVIGDGEKYCAALIIPSSLCSVEKLSKEIEAQLEVINQTLAPWETIKKFVISTAPMTIESGELTPTMKKKRKVILEKRKEDILKIYS